MQFYLIFTEDKAWVDCSIVKKIYIGMFIKDEVDKVLKKGDITLTDAGKTLYYAADDPQIFLSKGNKIKVLNFGWRCWYEMGPELNYER